MHKLLEQLNSILTGTGKEESVELCELKVEFLKKQKDILRTLQLCKKSGGIIGIYSETLGKGMFLVTVSQIVDDRTVALRMLDSKGALSSKTLLGISEIASVCPFNQIYQEPLVEEEKYHALPSSVNLFQHIN